MTARISVHRGERASPTGGGAVPQSLVAQTFTILKEKIQVSEWVRLLPSERELCELLVVSRGTLRKALSRLAREGLLRSCQGRRWQIIKTGPPRGAKVGARHVALLTPFPLNVVAPFEIYWIDSLRAHLQDAGYRLDVYQNLDCRDWRYNKVLEEMSREVSPAGWVLRSSSEKVQKWFSERSLPCVIVGSRHSDVALPSLDRDLPAVCRHAVGRLVGKGHTRLALLIPNSGLAGDLACENSFRETAEKMLKERNGEVVIARHNGTREEILRRLSALMDHRSRPTGFLVTDTRYTLSAITFFQQRGLQMPKNVALISRDNDHFLEYITPTIARYSTDPSLFALKVARMVLRLVEGDEAPARDYRVVPSFLPGETLG